jgi:hypothetical protein
MSLSVPGEGMKDKSDRFEAEGRSRDLVVFSLVRESKCSECNKELRRGDFLFRDGERGLCMPCADLDELVYLPSGDAALSRRARMHSPLSAVVVRFSRARKRYERQGILVSEVALEEAEAKCLADSELRALRRERDAERRAQCDRDLVAQMTQEISRVFPGCPPKVAQTIAEHTLRRGSGRVGRTGPGQSLEEGALTLAVVAHIRHRYTNYDELLMSGYERSDARAQIHDEVDRVLDRWRKGMCRICVF